MDYAEVVDTFRYWAIDYIKNMLNEIKIQFFTKNAALIYHVVNVGAIVTCQQ